MVKDQEWNGTEEALKILVRYRSKGPVFDRFNTHRVLVIVPVLFLKDRYSAVPVPVDTGPFHTLTVPIPVHYKGPVQGRHCTGLYRYNTGSFRAFHSFLIKINRNGKSKKSIPPQVELDTRVGASLAKMRLGLNKPFGPTVVFEPL